MTHLIPSLTDHSQVIAISTDYRDLRKSAYQQYAISLDYNLIHIPPSLSYEKGSTLGVAFVAATLALGVSLGLDFSGIFGGPNLLDLVRGVESESIPTDVAGECFDGIQASERLRSGDWLAVWGGK